VLIRNWSKLQIAVHNRATALLNLEKTFVKCYQKYRIDFSGLFGESQPLYRRGEYLLSGNTQVEEDQIPFLQSLPTEDAQTMEILARLDAVEPKYRPTHRVGFMGIMGKKVDSALYYAQEFRKWDDEVKMRRRTPERSKPTAVAIVTFESPLGAQVTTQVIIHRKAFTIMTKTAPEPRDMFWPNLSGVGAGNYSKLFRSLFVFGGMFGLVFFSFFVVSSIAGLIDLRQLAKIFPVIGEIIDQIPDAQLQFIQGVIPTVLLSSWTSLLPSVLLIMCKAQGLEAISWVEHSLLSK
jgi:Cytosolic domain of 10TM putative phosphate transporter/Calcium-dependent channel, 7TM region, putative phosphate